jgi:hypothetical protein
MLHHQIDGDSDPPGICAHSVVLRNGSLRVRLTDGAASITVLPVILLSSILIWLSLFVWLFLLLIIAVARSKRDCLVPIVVLMLALLPLALARRRSRTNVDGPLQKLLEMMTLLLAPSITAILFWNPDDGKGPCEPRPVDEPCDADRLCDVTRPLPRVACGFARRDFFPGPVTIRK